MVATPPTLTATFDSNTGLVTTSWTATDQRDFKISVTRNLPRREREPSYGTERYKGQFQASVDAGDPQAHLIHDQGSLRDLVWDGGGETSGTICNGTWRVRMYYINTAGERSSTVEDTVRVFGVPCPGEEDDDDDDRPPGELPAPVLTSPTAGRQFNNQNVLVSWTVPSGYAQASYKVSVYRADQVNSQNEPLPSVGTADVPYGTIRELSHRTPWTGSHYANGGDTSVTFSDTSPNGNAQICTGSYVVRVRYRDGQRRTSAVASRRFSVINVDCPEVDPTPEEPAAPSIPAGSAGVISLIPDERWSQFSDNTWNVTASDALILRWSAVFASGLPQDHFIIQRQVTAVVRDSSHNEVSRSTVEHYYTGARQGPIWSTSNLTNVDGGATFASLRGNAPAASTRAANWLEYWWGQDGAQNRWQNNRPDPATGNYTIYTNIRFLITAVDTAGNRLVSDWYTFLPQSFPAFTLTRQTGFAGLRFRLVLSDVTIGSSNRITDFKIAVYERNSDGTQGPIVAGTTRFRGQPLDAPGAHWAPITLLGVSETVIVDADFTPSIYFSNYLPAGDYIVAARITDLFGKVSNRRTHHIIGWSPPVPQVREIVPVRLTALTGGVPTTAPPLTGLAEGIGVALIYYTPTGTTGTTTPDEVSIERREFSREDNQPLNTQPVEIFTWNDRQTSRPPAPAFANIQGTAIWWFYDLSAASGVQYEYRVTNIDTRTGGRRIGNWVP